MNPKNLPALRRKIPAPTPEVAKSLSPQQLAEHRQQIASEVRIVLSAYFQPHEDEATKAGQLAWWCDELEDWTREQVVYALRQWNRDSPRARPTPGDITGILKATRGKMEAKRMEKPPPAPERVRTTKEEASKAILDAGFRVNEHGRIVGPDE